MKILVVGSGGREHALIREIKNSSLVRTVYAWPGNAGHFLDAVAVDVQAGDYAALVAWAQSTHIDLVVIGPEVELVHGLADMFRHAGILVFGPEKRAAQLEGSKVFAKKFMQEYGVPTARAEVVSDVAGAMAAAQKFSAPYVLKADGLAAGKGVFICDTLADLETAAEDIFVRRKLGDAGAQALVEEFQPGQEISVLVLTNGWDFQVLPFSRDHKRLLDGDRGPNTGGMGVVGPVKLDSGLTEKIIEQVVRPSVLGLSRREYTFRGVLFIGVMLTAEGPRVLEYNVRFGDPETQVVLPLLAGDWALVLKTLAEGQLLPLSWHEDRAVACVVMAAEGYPDAPVKGVKIEGDLTSHIADDSYVLHAGTSSRDGNFLVNGGRVLNVMGVGADVRSALKSAYGRVDKITWPGCQFRRDIGVSI
jgi:phosphoribosylamine--glycine ligase